MPMVPCNVHLYHCCSVVSGLCHNACLMLEVEQQSPLARLPAWVPRLHAAATSDVCMPQLINYH